MFRPIKIRHYVAYMQSRGFTPQETLEGTGIEPAHLRNAGCLIEFLQYQTVVANMMRLTGNQGIGLEIGQETEITDLGILGHAMMSSTTAREALNLWLRFSNSLVGMMTTLRLHEHDHEHDHGSWSLTISEVRPMGFLYNFGVEEFMSIAVKLGEGLIKKKFIPSLMELSFPAPAHHDLYVKHFRCEPRFNSRRTCIRFEAPPLSTPLKGFDDEFHALCLRHCDQLLKQISAASPVVSRIRTLLLSKMKGMPSLEEVAREISLSPRSLRRHLQAEGHSYTSLIHQFRIDVAKEHLGASRLTAKETAYLLGYKDTNAFRRAFKTWTGLTVHEFQESAAVSLEH